MSEPDSLSTVYASDENVAVRCSGDFPILAPDWQKVAYGADGAFAPGSPWTLTSATVDFGAAGAAFGHVVALRKPASAFKGSGELLAVETASGAALSLRRIGAKAGAGAPPAPVSGLVGVEFVVATLAPQIEEASFDLNRRFNIDPSVPGRTPADLHDLRELRQACVLTVLARRYAAETRGDRGDFALKLQQARDELSEVLARLEVRWGAGGSDGRSTSLFSTRIVR
jgi:hypothetical protein